MSEVKRRGRPRKNIIIPPRRRFVVGDRVSWKSGKYGLVTGVIVEFNHTFSYEIKVNTGHPQMQGTWVCDDNELQEATP